MNIYFRSVGMCQIKTKQKLNKIVDSIIKKPDEQLVLGQSNSGVFMEYYKKYGENFGLIVRRMMNNKEKLKEQKTYPYAFTDNYLCCENMAFENIDGDYIVMCEDVSTGNELVFQLQNVLGFIEDGEAIPPKGKVNIVGLSVNATVILPVAKDEKYMEMRKEEERYYKDLMDKAREGDAKAKELLEIQEEETSNIIHERLFEEDFLTVVEGFFIPMDDDITTYQILGDIMKISEVTNQETEDIMYMLTVDITGSTIDVCINKKDLQGLPSVGMRFMGGCWLQGRFV